jgi:hypothetical protein
MKTRLLLMCAVLALATWAVAQTNSAERNLGDKVDITSGPNVTTTQNSATIRWQTNGQAATMVKYGTDANNMSQEQKHAGGSRSHNVELTGLQPGTTYHYAVLNDDGAVRQQGTFTTKGANSAATTDNDRDRDMAANQSGTMTTGASDSIHITMGPEIRNFNGNSATLYWQTDKTAANEVHYGTSPSDLNQKAYEPGGSTTHSVQLSSLQPGQTVYFEILRNNGSIREPGSFTLPSNVNATATSATGTYPAIPVQMGNGAGPMYGGNTPTYGGGNMPTTTGAVQITNGPVIESVSDTTAVVSWSTNQPSSSTVQYGQSWLALNQTAQAAWGATTHRVTINNLKPNTKYYFRVQSAQAQGTGQVARSQFGTFQTGAPGQAAQAPR